VASLPTEHPEIYVSFTPFGSCCKAEVVRQTRHTHIPRPSRARFPTFPGANGRQRGELECGVWWGCIYRRVGDFRTEDRAERDVEFSLRCSTGHGACVLHSFTGIGALVLWCHICVSLSSLGSCILYIYLLEGKGLKEGDESFQVSLFWYNFSVQKLHIMLYYIPSDLNWEHVFGNTVLLNLRWCFCLIDTVVHFSSIWLRRYVVKFSVRLIIHTYSGMLHRIICSISYVS
jgi:hypothetical protein